MRIYEVYCEFDDDYDCAYVSRKEAWEDYKEPLKDGICKIIEQDYGYERFREVLGCLGHSKYTLVKTVKILWNALSDEEKKRVFEDDLTPMIERIDDE